mgnify:CR=1 FL=1
MAAKAINIEFTVNAWAKALGTTEATLKSKLTKADLPKRLEVRILRTAAQLSTSISSLGEFRIIKTFNNLFKQS